LLKSHGGDIDFIRFINEDFFEDVRLAPHRFFGSGLVEESTGVVIVAKFNLDSVHCHGQCGEGN